MNEPIVITGLALGWLAQAASWMRALARVGPGSASARERRYELALRAGQIGLIIWALAAGRHPTWPLGAAATATWLAASLAGHGVAIAGRLRLGAAWGIGTRPRPGPNPVVRDGIYRLLAHPIYVGTGVAVIAQAVVLQNLPALLLVLGAAMINPWKMARENRWLREASDQRNGT